MARENWLPRIILDIGKVVTVVEKIRLLQVMYSFDVEGSGGGIARFVISLCRALDKKLFDVSICGLWNMGVDSEQAHIRSLNAEGIKAFTASEWDPGQPLLSLIHSYRRLSEFIDESPADIIHSHSEFSDIVTLLLKFHPGNPLILRTLHNGYPLEWRKRPLRRFVLSNMLYPIFYNSEIGVAEHVVINLNQRWLAKQLKREGTLLRNAIDMNRFNNIQHMTEKSKLGLGIPDEAFVIGTVGRLREEKGYEYLIEAASMLTKQFTDPFYILIVGAGDLETQLTDLARNYHVDERVIFIGPRQDIEFLLSGMDVFACTSLWEGFSTAVLEAMAAGVPVIATDIPGNQELIEPGVNGWLVAPRDSAALSNAIANFISTPALDLQIITEAAKKTASRFSIKRVAEQHEIWYKQLMEIKKG